jgi:hypothetical protein
MSSYCCILSSCYYMCLHTTVCVLILLYVSSYYIVRMLIYVCPHTTEYVTHTTMCPHITACVLIFPYVSSYYYVCPHTSTCMCPPTTIYMCPPTTVCVLILLHVCPHTSICVLMQARPEDYVSSVLYVCSYRWCSMRLLSHVLSTICVLIQVV